MNYRKIYYDLVLSAKLYPKKSDYYETHHIQPRSMGGSNDSSNLVKFTGRQHYIVHWLLYKIHKNWKMAEAWRMMSIISPDHRSRYTSHTFEYARKTALKHRIGQKRSDETKRKIGIKHRGKKLSESTKKKISEKSKSMIRTTTHYEKLSQSLKGRTKPKKITNKDIKQSKKQKFGTSNPMYGIFGDKHHSSKKVLQYSKEGEFIKEWVSATAAAKELGIKKGGISACCRGVYKQSRGYIWRFKED